MVPALKSDERQKLMQKLKNSAWQITGANKHVSLLKERSPNGGVQTFLWGPKETPKCVG